MPADLEHRPPGDRALRRKLERWVDESLITPAEALAIERFEAGEDHAVDVAETGAEPSERPRIPLVTEALGYLGAVLALAAGIFLLSDRWEDLDPVVRAIAIGIGAVALVAIGWLLRASDEPAIGRLASVLWFLASCGVLWSGWVLAYDALETSDRVAGITSGALALAVSAVLYLLRRRSLQQVALAGAITYTVGFAFFEPAPNGIAWWLLGVAWFSLGRADVLQPQRAALAVGAFLSLEGAMTLAEDVEGVAFLLGLATAAAVIAASVLLRETPLLVIGVVGLFVFLTRTVGYYFRDTLGAPIALLAAGAIVLAVAIVLARRGPTRTGPRSPS